MNALIFLFAAILLPGYSESAIATGFNRPTAMALAPDGRVFVTEQGGALRVVSAEGVLQPSPSLLLPVDSSGERGLIGITLDPAFTSNGYVYLHYTVPAPGNGEANNRVSRFTLLGDSAVPGSEQILLDLEPLGARTNHNGGAIRFGPDGKLYVAVGENTIPSNSQTLSNRLGKILRLNPDGTAAGGNPFGGTGTVQDQIWALGLRNPFQMAFHGLTGQLFINDVGLSSFEEINFGAPGANYGWPGSEGPVISPGITAPLYSYGRSEGCAITGGAFDATGGYYFADLCAGNIRRLDPSAGTASLFATGISFGLVDLAFSASGDLYYLYLGGGSIPAALFLISFPASAEVPEPGALMLMLGGLCLLLGRLRRR